MRARALELVVRAEHLRRCKVAAAAASALVALALLVFSEAAA